MVTTGFSRLGSAIFKTISSPCDRQSIDKRQSSLAPLIVMIRMALEPPLGLRFTTRKAPLYLVFAHQPRLIAPVEDGQCIVCRVPLKGQAESDRSDSRSDSRSPFAAMGCPNRWDQSLPYVMFMKTVCDDWPNWAVTLRLPADCR